ncbi:MAG: cell wall anchor protein [Solirubrobacterales bacterium]|nr:cell wall anchor protein [Solirubrobacterales bacterium]
MRATLPTMPRAHSVAIALSAAALAVPSAALGQGSSGAGDDQYADPFDNGNTSTTQTTTGSQTSGGGSTLSQDPNLGGSPTTSGTSTTAPSATGTTTPTTALPNTGSDPRLLILAGLALLLSGLGLRLRTADEIF